MFQIFVIIGSVIYVLLGFLHGFYTLQDVRRPRYLAPRNMELLNAMRESAVILDAEINLWRAWLGFNFSYSLGVLIFGGAFLYIGVFHSLFFAKSPFLQICTILASAAYVFLSLKFWFSKPALFTGIATVCFILAAALSFIQ